MLFHVTATHTAEDCPGYNLQRMPEVVTSLEKLESLAKELNVKVHFLVNGAPEHVSFALLEADNPGAVARVVNSIAIRQDFKVTPVQREEDLMALARAMMGQR